MQPNQKHILKIEAMIINYQLYGTDFLDEAIKDFLSTAVISNNDVDKKSSFWTAFEAWGNKLVFISKTVDSANKLVGSLTPLISMLS